MSVFFVKKNKFLRNVTRYNTNICYIDLYGSTQNLIQYLKVLYIYLILQPKWKYTNENIEKKNPLINLTAGYDTTQNWMNNYYDYCVLT